MSGFHSLELLGTCRAPCLPDDEAPMCLGCACSYEEPGVDLCEELCAQAEQVAIDAAMARGLARTERRRGVVASAVPVLVAVRCAS